MSEFDTLGRDVAAAAEANCDPAVATAVKALWSYAGFDQGDNPDHLWTVSADFTEDGFTVSAAVKDANVYVPPPVPDAPATEAELARAAVVAAEAVDTAVETAPAEPALVEEPAASAEAPAPTEEPAPAEPAAPVEEAAPAETPAPGEPQPEPEQPSA